MSYLSSEQSYELNETSDIHTLDENTQQLLEFCKAVADPIRLRLIAVLQKYELNVNELVQLFDMGQSRISRHLKILSASGLLLFRREGLWVFYSSNKNGTASNFIQALKPFMQNNISLNKDLIKAKQLLDQRSLNTKMFFNHIADDWDKLNKEILGQFNLGLAVAERMPNCTCAVDLGCGTGQLLLAMQDKCKILIGVDGSARMLELAKKQNFASTVQVSLRIGDLEHLPLKDAEADFVTVNMVLHHLNAPFNTLEEIKRILSADGYLLITDFAHHNQEDMRVRYGDLWLGLDFNELEKRLKTLEFAIVEHSSFSVEKNLQLRLILAQKK
ncbi:ArsR/SmtB family transcription factor [Desulfovibrio litoralis]|nr:metalloregulator ArsR/SmtB family transcription factor [Desulfovibrio litoralis]